MVSRDLDRIMGQFMPEIAIPGQIGEGIYRLFIIVR
jgi:hypothetical protein